MFILASLLLLQALLRGGSSNSIMMLTGSENLNQSYLDMF